MIILLQKYIYPCIFHGLDICLEEYFSNKPYQVSYSVGEFVGIVAAQQLRIIFTEHGDSHSSSFSIFGGSERV